MLFAIAHFFTRMNGHLPPFARADLSLPSLDVMRHQYPDLEDDQLRAALAELSSHEVWLNSQYQVNINKSPQHGFPGAVLWHLSIKRIDKRPVHDWRDLQAIKNALVGPQYEAIELYPSTERTVDQANQYHLWVFISQDGDAAPKLPFGWTSRQVQDTGVRQDKSVQRGLHRQGETI